MLVGVIAAILVGVVVWAMPSEATPTLQTVDMAVLQDDYGLSLADPEGPSQITQAAAEAAAEAEYPEAGQSLEAVYAKCFVEDSVDEHCWAVSLDPGESWELPVTGTPEYPDVVPEAATSMVVLVSDKEPPEALATMVW